MAELAYNTTVADTSSFKSSEVIILISSFDWLYSDHTTSGEALSFKDERLVASAFNSILGQFDDPDSHKSFNTVEELFADLDKEEETEGL